jgi:hypothetical protein
MVIVEIPFGKPVFDSDLGRCHRDEPGKTIVTAALKKIAL